MAPRHISWGDWFVFSVGQCVPFMCAQILQLSSLHLWRIVAFLWRIHCGWSCRRDVELYKCIAELYICSILWELVQRKWTIYRSHTLNYIGQNAFVLVYLVIYTTVFCYKSTTMTCSRIKRSGTTKGCLKLWRFIILISPSTLHHITLKELFIFIQKFCHLFILMTCLTSFLQKNPTEITSCVSQKKVI